MPKSCLFGLLGWTQMLFFCITEKTLFCQWTESLSLIYFKIKGFKFFVAGSSVNLPNPILCHPLILSVSLCLSLSFVSLSPLLSVHLSLRLHVSLAQQQVWMPVTRPVVMNSPFPMMWVVTRVLISFMRCVNTHYNIVTRGGNHLFWDSVRKCELRWMIQLTSWMNVSYNHE